jgi:UDP-3-O-[3-hydroxymyristoyl] glucosamine N-acyltransferase
VNLDMKFQHSLIHPTAYVSPSVVINVGTIILPKSVINANVVIDKGCIISIGALINHDSQLGTGVHINTGAIVKVGSKAHSLKKIDAEELYSSESKLDDYNFEVGI